MNAAKSIDKTVLRHFDFRFQIGIKIINPDLVLIRPNGNFYNFNYEKSFKNIFLQKTFENRPKFIKAQTAEECHCVN